MDPEVPIERDSSPKVAIVVEGEMDRRVVQYVAASTSVAVDTWITPMSGKQRAIRHFTDLATHGLDQYDQLVLLVDADTWRADEIGAQREQVLSQIPADHQDRVHVVFAVPSIEAWLIAGTNTEAWTEAMKDEGSNLRKQWKELAAESGFNPRAVEFDIALARGRASGLEQLIRVLQGASTGD